MFWLFHKIFIFPTLPSATLRHPIVQKNLETLLQCPLTLIVSLPASLADSTGSGGYRVWPCTASRQSSGPRGSGLVGPQAGPLTLGSHV